MRYALLLSIVLACPAYSWWPQPVLLPEDASARLSDMEKSSSPVPERSITLVSDPALEASRAWLAGYLNSVSGSLDSFFRGCFFWRRSD